LELTYNRFINGCPKNHLHDKLCIVAIKKGGIKLKLNNKSIKIDEDEIYIINPYQIHSAVKIDSKSKDLYAMYIDKDWIKNLQADIFNTDKFIPFKKNIIKERSLHDEFLDICDLLTKKYDSNCTEERIVYFIYKLLKKERLDLNVKDERNILFADIKRYIDENLTNDLTLQSVANQFLITPFHLIRIFKKELNLTPYQYIIVQKTNLAKELLSRGLSISQTAQEAGFVDQSHLYKYFKQIFSITPKEYLQSLK